MTFAAQILRLAARQPRNGGSVVNWVRRIRDPRPAALLGQRSPRSGAGASRGTPAPPPGSPRSRSSARTDADRRGQSRPPAARELAQRELHALQRERRVLRDRAAISRTRASSSVFGNTAFTSPSAAPRGVVAARGEEDLLRGRGADQRARAPRGRPGGSRGRAARRGSRTPRRPPHSGGPRASAVAMPPPMQKPWIIASTGLPSCAERAEGAAASPPRRRWPRRPPVRAPSNSEMSAPDTNATSPAPRSTTTRTEVVRVELLRGVGSASHISWLIAFRRSG